MRSPETLLAAVLVVVLGVAAGIVAGVSRASSPVAPDEPRPSQRFAVEIAGRQIVIVVGTAPPASPTPTPAPTRNPAPSQT